MYDSDTVSSQPPVRYRSLWGQMSFVLATLAMLIFFRNHPVFDTLSITFVSIVLEALPFMLIGALIGGLIEVFISQDAITRILPERRLITFFMAAGLGLVFPVCECAIVPVVRRLLHKGLPLGAAVAFLLGGPIVNPIVAASTAVAYSFWWTVVIDRLLFGYLIAVTIGILMDLFFSKGDALLPSAHHDYHHDSCHHHDGYDCGHHHPQTSPATASARLNMALRHAVDDFMDVTRFLIIGAFIAGVLQALVSRQAFVSVMEYPIASILLMMVLAFILNLCSEADAFVAASFKSTMVPLSAQLAFMVLGPMLDIKLVLMYLRVFKKRFILSLAGVTFLLVFLVMVAREILT